MPGGVKYTYEYVKNYFKDQNCEMLDTYYKNARTHINYRCSCGNKSKIIFDSFRRGHRCNKCASIKRGKRQTLTFDYVYNFFKENGCEMIDDTYINSLTKIKYKCKCDNIGVIRFHDFKKGHRCYYCCIIKRSGKNNYQWVEDRVAFEEMKKFKQKCYKMVKYCLEKTCQEKTERTYKMLGYTSNELKDYIYNHPNWKKVKNKKWHLDHIFPVKAFLDYGIKNLKLINSLDNLRPLLAKENMSKNDNYDVVLFKEWLIGKKYEF